MWTEFMDMHSGGSKKEKWSHIFIEAPEKEAKIVFYNKFGHNPERVTCTCCGNDYSISEYESIEQATGYERGCNYNNDTHLYDEIPMRETTRIFAKKYMTVDEYFLKNNVLKISASEIKPEEKEGEIPKQGYVWIE